MSRGTWYLIQQSKRFYVRAFRNVGSALIFSTTCNLLLIGTIYYVYFSQTENAFYATDGVTPPIMLTPMSEPNQSAYPLLANDQSMDDANRVIPE